MQISDFLVKQCYSSITFCGFLRKKSYILERASFEQHDEFQIRENIDVALVYSRDVF